MREYLPIQTPEERSEAAITAISGAVQGVLGYNEVLREKQLRHADNVSRLHGVFYKGTYYHKGIPQRPK